MRRGGPGARKPNPGAFVCYLRHSMCQALGPQPSADYLSLLGVTNFGEFTMGELQVLFSCNLRPPSSVSKVRNLRLGDWVF
jgi:hypothetical protein